MHTNGLSLRTLREANRKRLPNFKNKKGEPAHSEPDGSDWSLTDWMTAVAGEVGEAANIIKKIRRGDMTLEEARPALGRELADVLIYLDILAFQAGIELERITVTKFNETTKAVGAHIRLREDDDWEYTEEGLASLKPIGIPLPPLKEIQIWMEGYAATGESGTAKIIGSYMATSFDDAIRQYNDEHSENPAVYTTPKDYQNKAAFVNRRSSWQIWACNLFDNEADARVAFG